MGTLDEIKRMKQEGKSDQEIINALLGRGITKEEISEALSEDKIKEAVDYPEADMQPSIMSAGEEVPQPGQETPMPEQTAEYPQEQYPAPAYQNIQQPYAPESYPQEQYPTAEYPQDYNYPAYQPSGLSPDTITEIAEQVIQEKLGETSEKLKQISAFRNSMEAKMEGIDSRLVRIEKVIDRLQLSVLQKVGDYINNVDDIKKELIETQKSFRSLLPEFNRAAEKTLRKSKE